jgi:electron transfer flavoprotein beta subunit
VNILVCVKQVVDPTAPLRLTADACAVHIGDETPRALNEYDAQALEIALRLRESGAAARVDAITVGPPRAEQALRRALAMGADRGGHVLADDDAEQDPAFVAAAIAEFATTGDYDIILTGVLSSDGENGVTGPTLAARLGLPCVTGVVTVAVADERLEVGRDTDGGGREFLSLPRPTVLTIQTGVDRPRYPAVSGLLRAAKMELLHPNPPPRESAPLPVVGYQPPQRLRAGRLLSGSPAAQAAQLIAVLRERNLFKARP